MTGIITSGIIEFNKIQSEINAYLFSKESHTDKGYSCAQYCLPSIVNSKTGQIFIPCEGKYMQRIKELGYTCTEIDRTNLDWFPDVDE